MKRTFFSLVAIFSMLSFNQQTQANSTFVGIGITIQKLWTGKTEIVGLIENGPAQKAGVQIGEELIAVDGQSTQGKSIEKTSALLSGPENSKVVLTLKNKNQSARDVALIRTLITVSCFMEGSINLNMSGNGSSGFISGYVGNQYLSLNVFSNQASGSVNGEYISLNLNESGYQNYSLSGWIRNTYVQWNSNGASGFYGYQSCIY
jgi:hypothetical protein